MCVYIYIYISLKAITDSRCVSLCQGFPLSWAVGNIPRGRFQPGLAEMHVQSVGAGCCPDSIRCKSQGCTHLRQSLALVGDGVTGKTGRQGEKASVLRQPMEKVRDGGEERFALWRCRRGNPGEKEKREAIAGTRVMATDLHSAGTGTACPSLKTGWGVFLTQIPLQEVLFTEALPY